MQVEARRLLLGAVVVSLVATAAIAIGTLLVGDFGATEGRVLLTTASISFFSLLSLAPGILLEQGRLRPLALAGLGLAGIGLLLALNLIWLQFEEDLGEGHLKAFAVATVLALAAAQAAGVESRRRPHDPAWVRRLALASHASAALVAALVCAAILWEIGEEGYFRGLGAAVVVNLLLVALQPVLRRLGAPADMHRLACVLVGGGRVERELAARDFAAAVERAIRELERDGERVVSVERL